jgi:enoyl-CoA hydratase
LAKECVNQSFELSLSEGNLYERRVFHSTFGLVSSQSTLNHMTVRLKFVLLTGILCDVMQHDQKEGMHAFIEKRTPQWKHQ